MTRDEWIAAFTADYDAGRIQYRARRWVPSVTQEELDAGVEPAYVAYTGMDGPYADAIHAAIGEDD